MTFPTDLSSGTSSPEAVSPKPTDTPSSKSSSDSMGSSTTGSVETIPFLPSIALTKSEPTSPVPANCSLVSGEIFSLSFSSDSTGSDTTGNVDITSLS